MKLSRYGGTSRASYQVLWWHTVLDFEICFISKLEPIICNLNNQNYKMEKVVLVAFDNYTDIDIFLAWDLLNRVKFRDQESGNRNSHRIDNLS